MQFIYPVRLYLLLQHNEKKIQNSPLKKNKRAVSVEARAKLTVSTWSFVNCLSCDTKLVASPTLLRWRLPALESFVDLRSNAMPGERLMVSRLRTSRKYSNTISPSSAASLENFRVEFLLLFCLFRIVESCRALNCGALDFSKSSHLAMLMSAISDKSITNRGFMKCLFILLCVLKVIFVLLLLCVDGNRR